MPLMYTFCTWFPLRLGTVIVGIISIFQSLLSEGVCFFSLGMTDVISNGLHKLLHNNNMAYSVEILKSIEKDPKFYILGVMIYNLVYTISCFILIYGAYKNTIMFILPYIILEFIRLAFILYIVATSMILIKMNVLNFLVLILVSVIGVVFLQLLIYMWCCPVSLVQCLRIVRKTVGHANDDFDIDTIGIPKVLMVNNHDLAFDPSSDYFGWRPFKPSYSYPYENMPQYEY
ncbi:uncharacterized protein LOC126910353 [Daktulosphaira vitifoliae]|uniref:uncharacterized protein LOC126910353 n=1 Tax=Daktulosphaira vitifoliae TaxID=58002 RepID=UPI0021A98F59|nr:uncharacterized protein LOC126910353 [Daktulosphaira vitifoliae]XP_050548804.1 uncharacterized protein LOC126910353 [Daktulosphaira vitifoliae]XP_050548805.1 uncharacterized protein LOC126910353 [Daktulosphaira vitifoliae]XP_050548806.1 uncharacterized protein LOC126910353 [Daktulosphaira vitifoliae]